MAHNANAGDAVGSDALGNSAMSGHSPPTKLPSKQQFTDLELTDLSIIDSMQGSIMLDSSVDLQMRFQRLLAESVLDNSAELGTSLKSSCLEPTEESVAGHSRNASSCSVSKSHLDNDEFESIMKKLSEEELGKVFKKFASEKFIPAEFALEKLETDEIQWNKENIAANEKQETSNFSGILGDAEISVSSSVVPGIRKKKVSADEFFKLKTDTIGTLNTSGVSAERPNFGSNIVSPQVGRTCIPLISSPLNETVDLGPCESDAMMSSSSGKISELSQHSTEDCREELLAAECDVSCKSMDAPVGCSTLSTSGIEKIISEHLQDSTQLLAEKLVQGDRATKSASSSGLSNSATAAALSHSVLSRTVDNNDIEIEHLQEVEAVLGSKIAVSIQIKNSSIRWLRCNVMVQKIVCLEKQNVEEQDLMLVNVGDAAIISPNEVASQMINVTPQIAGHFLMHINISLEDAVTKNMLQRQSCFEVVCKIPKFEVKMSGQSISELNFGFIPENCIERIHAQLFYASEPLVALAVKLSVEEASSSDKKFFLTRGKTQDLDSLSFSYTNCGARLMHFTALFKAPIIEDGSRRDDLHSFSAYLNISIEVGGKPFLLKKLKLHARSGYPRLAFAFPTPVILHSSGVGVLVSKSLALKNDGVIPLHVEVSAVSDNKTNADSDGVIFVNNGNMIINPGQEAKFDVSFLPSWTAEKLLKRKVVVQILPGGEKLVFEVHGIVKKANLQDSASSSDSDSSAKSSKLNMAALISTTHKQLVWTTVPVGKSETLSCRLRNDGPNPVKVKLSLVDSSHSYRLLSEHGEIVNYRKFKLHSKECMTFRVTFSPAHPGVACAKITVSVPSRGGDSGERFAIPLYGFGGTFNLQIRDIPKDANGCMWLNLGHIDSTMHTQFTLHNKGNLGAFVYIKYTPKGVGTLLQKTNIKISSSQIILPPGTSETVQVSLRIDRDDVQFVSEDPKELLQIGNLHLICGDEPTRHRIRRITERGLAKSSKNLVIDLDGLCTTFPSEKSIVGVDLLDDPESHLRVLYRTLQQHELALTVEKFGDRSLAMQTCIGNSNFINSSIFKSMLEDAISDSESFENPALWTVTPSVLNLLVPCFGSGCLTIGSNHSEDQPFEVSCPVNFLTIEPQCGVVPSMGEAIVIVTCDVNGFQSNPSPRSLLKVYLENDVKTVTVVTKKMEEATVGQMAAMRGQQMMASEEEFLSSHNQLSSIKKIRAKTVSGAKTVVTAPHTLSSPRPSSGVPSTVSSSIEPFTYDIIFPLTPVGRTSYVNFKIENTEPRPLKVQVHISPPFTVEEKVILLKEKGTSIVKLSFSPSAVGKIHQSMVLSLQDRQPQTYSVNGEGV